jgi:hypothetical protein
MNHEFCPGKVWNDTEGKPINAHGGGILYHDGIYYWHGECRPEGPDSQDALIGVSCYRSKDLLNWENCGVALSVVKDDPGHPLASGCKIERPKVLFNKATGKFVMWWHHDIRGWGHACAYAGIAVAERPEGPFRFIEIIKPCGRMARDCTLFQDTGGTAYFICASDDNANLNIHRLSDDYQKPSGFFMQAFTGRFMEAPCVFKHDGRYFFIGSDCTGWTPNEARSASAPEVFGPWKELGNPCLGEGADATWGAQSTFVLPVAGRQGAFIFMADIWKPNNLADSRHVWLPLFFKKAPAGFMRPHFRWHDRWDMSIFKGRPG